MSLTHRPEDCQYCHTLGNYGNYSHGYLYFCDANVLASLRVPYPDGELYVTNAAGGVLQFAQASAADRYGSLALKRAKVCAIDQGWLIADNKPIVAVSEIGDALERLS